MAQIMEEKFYPSYIVSDVYHRYITQAASQGMEEKGRTFLRSKKIDGCSEKENTLDHFRVLLTGFLHRVFCRIIISGGLRSCL